MSRHGMLSGAVGAGGALRILGALVAFAVCGAAIGSCASMADYIEAAVSDARESAGRRDYERAQEVLDAALTAVGDDFALLYEKAEIYARAHEYDAAAAAYAEAAALEPRSWKAVSRAWEAEFRRDGETDAARDRVLALADEFVAAAPDSLVNLSAAVALYVAVADDDYGTEVKERLTTLYPDSELGSELIKEEVDWIGVERDDRTRLDMAETFLEKHPVSKWRARVMRLKLISLKRMERFDAVESQGRAWASEHPDSGEDLNIVASAFVSCGLVPDEAAAMAARAVELELARGAEDVARGRETRGARHGAGKRADGERRGDELASYCLTRARALVLAKHYAEAVEEARRAMSFLDVTMDDEETGAAYHFTLGRALEGMGEYDGAMREYLSALVAGGRQNRWPARADTAASRLLSAEFAAEASGLTLVEFARLRLRYDGPVFSDVTAEAGLSDRRESRVAWGDFDGDGYDDLLLNGRVLMRNDGDGTFTDVTEAAGIGGTGTNGGVWADIDNDGDLDFYATSGATSGELTDRLWVNRGDGTFEDATAAALAEAGSGDDQRAGAHVPGSEAEPADGEGAAAGAAGPEAVRGMADQYTTEGAAWGDYDADGLVDLYLASYERPRTGDFTDYGVGFPDILYRNVGGGKFVDVSEEAGIVPPFGRHLSGRGVNWGDYDNDGDLDIFVSNYRLQENFLWRNEGDGTFRNVAPELGVSGNETDGWWGHTIGSEWGDFDLDGDLDLVCANLAHPRYIDVSDRTMLLRNEGAPSWGFTDARAAAGIKYAETHSDPSWGDVDADGDLDLFITSIYGNCGTFLYRNLGRGRFEDITWLAGVRSFNGWGAAMSDYDLDGDLDIAVASGSGFHLFRNDGPAGGGRLNHWLEVVVKGTESNAAGIGARVTVTQDGRSQIREIEGGKGTTSQHSLTAFFGLGGSSEPVDVEVRFLGGGVAAATGQGVDRRLVIVEERRR